jgi:hypothetical protein
VGIGAGVDVVVEIGAGEGATTGMADGATTVDLAGTSVSDLAADGLLKALESLPGSFTTVGGVTGAIAATAAGDFDVVVGLMMA